MKKLRKILAVLLTVSMVMLNTVCVLAEAVPGGEDAEGSGTLGDSEIITYLCYNLETKTFQTLGKYMKNCTVITSETDDWEGWMVASGNVVIDDRVVVNEDVHLILEDGCTLTCKYGIEVETSSLKWKDDASLTIFAQSNGDRKGRLITTGDGDRAGIGSGQCFWGEHGAICGEITIHGGYIDAAGGEGAAGIGGGYAAQGAKVTIYGGEIVANGGKNGAGIGGGAERELGGKGGEGGELIVYGGVVTATGGENGAGIGGGNKGDDGGSVTIFGGTVTASCPTGGAGIGGGAEGNGARVTIMGGTVKATGNMYAAGIGGGNGGNGGTVTIHDSTVIAQGVYGGAGIGGGENGNGGDVEISRSTVGAYGVGGGAGIGGGAYANGGNVTLNSGSFKIESSETYAFGKGARGAEDGTISVGLGLCVFDKNGNRINGGFEPSRWENCGYFFAKGAKEFTVRASGDPVFYTKYDPMFGSDRSACSSYTYINRDIRQWTSGWYVVDDSGTFNKPVTVSGDVHLIIEDGKTLTAANGIRVEKGASLNIYAQYDGENRGKLIATGESNCAGIGGGDGKTGGAVTIHGCDVTANGGQNAAGIGGGQNGSGGSLTIYGGRVTATAGSGAARAIGAGKGGADHGEITVRDEYKLYDEAAGQNIERELSTFADWASLVNRPRHILTVVPSSSHLTDPVPYLYYDGNLNLQSAQRENNKLIRYDSYALDGGWYVLKDSVTLDHPLSVLGDVHLILTDGKTLTVNGGVCVNEGYSLTIHAQSEDGNKMGALIADAFDFGSAGIGANLEHAGDITIDGGRITARGGMYSAGIGGSDFSGCGNIKIHGGIVDAESAYAGAGIGSGRYDADFDFEYDSDDMKYDVEFIDWGNNGSIQITGGIVNARGADLGAGIGGGEGFDAGRITIIGGTVTAKGGDDGVGIGSGHVGYWDDDDDGWWRTAGVPGGKAEVTGGEVTAIGGGGTSIWEDNRGAFMADTLNIDSNLSVTVYNGNTPIAVGDPAQYASKCRDYNKVVIMPGVPGDVPVVPETGDHSAPMLWKAFMLVSLMGFSVCVVYGKRKRNDEE